jgi:hypothetical protein
MVSLGEVRLGTKFRGRSDWRSGWPLPVNGGSQRFPAQGRVESRMGIRAQEENEGVIGPGKDMSGAWARKVGEARKKGTWRLSNPCCVVDSYQGPAALTMLHGVRIKTGREGREHTEQYFIWATVGASHKRLHNYKSKGQCVFFHVAPFRGGERVRG